MKRCMYFLIPFAFFCSLRADTPIEILAPISGSIPIKFGGYIKNEGYWDTRQVIGFRDNEVLLYPEKKDLDKYCCDINGQGEYDMVAIQTRLRWELDGPKVKHAETSGVIEYDFFGREGIANIIRMRKAYMVLAWDKVEILAGQEYHPLYIINVDPRTISFNTGIPMETFARTPQFRATFKPTEHFSLLLCASSELDVTTDGPIGYSTTYLRNGVAPMLDIRFDWYWGEHRFGMGLDYKRIRPRLETNTGLKAMATLNTAIVQINNKLHWDSIDIRTKFIFAQNPTDQNMIGGYAVSSIDETTDQRTYTSLNVIAFWNDVDITKSKNVTPGWFIGVVKSLGARTTILRDVKDPDGNIIDRRVYGLGTDINYVFRIAPRVKWQINNFMLAGELEYTRAAYGTINDRGEVKNLDPVGNTRLLVSVFYFI